MKDWSKKMAFFSVIIPVYKVEKYLSECVDSVINQTFRDLEVILVDDGSPDRCPEICDAYAATDPRISVIHKKNGGLSSARNSGIDRANGRYLLFLDSDDYWKDSNVLQTLYSEISKNPWAQVVVCAAKLVYPDGTETEDHFRFSSMKCEQGSTSELATLIKKDLIIGSACTKVIERKYLLENNLRFKENIRCEDIEWIFRMSCLLPRYLYFDYHFYMYRQLRTGSISNTVSYEHIKEYLSIICEYCDNMTKDSRVQNIFLNYVSYQYSIVCAYIRCLKDKALKKELTNIAKKYEFLFEYDLNPKQNKISKLYKCFGFNLTLFFLKVYLTRRRHK